MAQHNEQRACGCRVYQETLGTIRWNRLEYCLKHKSASELLDALQAINEVWARVPEEFTAIVPGETRFLLERAISLATGK